MIPYIIKTTMSTIRGSGLGSFGMRSWSRRVKKLKEGKEERALGFICNPETQPPPGPPVLLSL